MKPCPDDSSMPVWMIALVSAGGGICYLAWVCVLCLVARRAAQGRKKDDLVDLKSFKNQMVELKKRKAEDEESASYVYPLCSLSGSSPRYMPGQHLPLPASPPTIDAAAAQAPQQHLQQGQMLHHQQQQQQQLPEFSSSPPPPQTAPITVPTGPSAMQPPARRQQSLLQSPPLLATGSSVGGQRSVVGSSRRRGIGDRPRGWPAVEERGGASETTVDWKSPQARIRL